MELKKIYEIIWKRKWVVIQAFLVITLVAIGASHLITPSYEARSRVLIKQVNNASGRISSLGLPNLPTLVTPPSNTQVNKALATSSPILNKVILKLQLRNEEGGVLTSKELLKSDVLSNLFPKPHIEVSQYQDTDLLEIKARSTDADEAMMMANTLAEELIEQSHKQTTEEYRRARIFVAQQMDKVKAQYNLALKELTTFKQQEKVVDLGTETKVSIEKIAELWKQKEDNIIDLAEAQAKMNTLKKQLDQQDAEFISVSSVSENPHIKELKKRLTELKLELTDALTKFNEGEPSVISLRGQIKIIEEQLTKETESYQRSAPELASLEREIAALEAHLAGVNADVNKYLAEFNKLPAKEASQARLEMALSASQRVYSSLLDYRNQIGIAEAMTLSNIRLIEPAVTPVIPVSPQQGLNGILGGFLGLMFGLGLAFLKEHLDDTISTPEDIRESNKLAFLGTIPRFKTTPQPLITYQKTTGPLYEAYRMMRHNIKFACPDKPLKSLLITSAWLGEGKTTTVANLAISVSRAGKRVLVMDTDLRKPTMHKLFDKSNQVGIVNILVEQVGINEAIIETEIDGVDLLPCGPIPPDPGRFIESRKMQQLIQELTQRYDLVILDSAPVLMVDDAVILAGYVDGIVSLLESGRATRNTTHEISQLLSSANIQPLGMVLNKFRATWGRYSYYHYGYGEKKVL